ncbi:MAG: PAS domain S-box protein [Proteobacteria bacterium]|nr:PAS domain S-box protein [Pseudomonadota bacterium]
MASIKIKKPGTSQKKGLLHNLLIVEVLVIVVPFLILFYMFHRNNIFLQPSQLIIIALTLVLILAGVIILRNIFNNFFMVAELIKKAGNNNNVSNETKKYANELQEVTISLNHLVEKFEKTNLDLSRRVFELFAVKELIEVASKSLDIDSLLNLLLEKAMAVSQAKIGSVFMYEADKNRLRTVVHKGLNSGIAKDTYININKSLLRQVLAKKKPLLVQNIESDPRTCKPNDPKYGPPSFLSMPIFIKQQLLAIINLAYKETQQVFDSDDEQILSILIGEIGFAIENAQLHSMIEEHLKNLKKRAEELTRTNHLLQKEITERKHAQKALKKSEEKYRTILQSIEYGYYEVDLHGNFTFYNDTMYKIFGYPQQELIGINNRQCMDEENIKKIFETFNLVSESVVSSKTFDFEITKKDGSKRTIETAISLMRDHHGQPLGLRGVARDVTEHKLAEKEIKKWEAKLQISQRLEAVGILAGGIAHNFNNLLMGIQGNAALALMSMDSSTPIYEKLQNIEKLVHGGAQLTGQLLGYARKGKYEVKPVNLNRLLKDLSDTFATTKKEIRFHLSLSEDLFWITADQGQIEQVIMNLFLNATDAMNGGGDLVLKTKNLSPEDLNNKPFKPKPGNYVKLSVKDSGAGMDKETMERIFEPFFTTKNIDKGTGLGLASVYGIIKGHGGHIDVDSEKGHGTTFNIFLPASTEKPQRWVEIQEPIKKGSGTILLVDDEEMILDVASLLLKNLGYTVIEAKGGKEAITLFEKNQDKIDLIILDMTMPDMGGGETFDRIKTIKSDVKVLLASGYSIKGQPSEIMKRGCNGFIQKPFDVKHLSRKVEEIISVV